MRLQDYDTTERYTATLVSSTRLTPESSGDEVRELVFELDRVGLGLLPGHSLGVIVPGQPEFGQDHHFRLYTVADLPDELPGGRTRVHLAVKRCGYIDEYSGERYPGRASNYLCDLQPGQTVTMTGPYGLPFEVPEELDANLILIGAGTGIAPFRAFVKHLYQQRPDFTGKVIMFHGGRAGVDLLYRNDEQDDFAQYYDRDTFQAIDALSNRPGWDERIDWGTALSTREDDIWPMIEGPWTYVYVAGLEGIIEQLDAELVRMAGSEATWRRRKAELVAGRRWVELVYG